nr:hypothetical protein [bacterium]
MKKISKLNFILALCSISFSTIGYADQAMSAEFRSLDDCLSGIKESSGKELKIITNEPEEVSGFLSNGKGFGCQEKRSGTKGTYFEGWYMV